MGRDRPERRDEGRPFGCHVADLARRNTKAERTRSLGAGNLRPQRGCPILPLEGEKMPTGIQDSDAERLQPDFAAINDSRRKEIVRLRHSNT